MYDIIIIGAGPAGLSAALYASRANLKTLILEKMLPGGQLANINEIENYPAVSHISGPDLANHFLEDALRFGAELVFEDALDVVYQENHISVRTSTNTYDCRSLIFATGSEPRRLGIPMEKELYGHGVSYCATCDGAFFRGKEVAVIGQNAHALEEAAFLTQHASRVSLLCPNSAPTAIPKDVKVYEGCHDFSLLSQNGMLSGVQWIANDDQSYTLEVSGLFISIGTSPANRLLSAHALSKTGHIQTDATMATDKPGVLPQAISGTNM